MVVWKLLAIDKRSGASMIEKFTFICIFICGKWKWGKILFKCSSSLMGHKWVIPIVWSYYACWEEPLTSPSIYFTANAFTYDDSFRRCLLLKMLSLCAKVSCLHLSIIGQTLSSPWLAALNAILSSPLERYNTVCSR